MAKTDRTADVIRAEISEKRILHSDLASQCDGLQAELAKTEDEGLQAELTKRQDLQVTLRQEIEALEDELKAATAKGE